MIRDFNYLLLHSLNIESAAKIIIRFIDMTKFKITLIAFFVTKNNCKCIQ